MSKRKNHRDYQANLPMIQVDAWQDDNGNHFVTLVTNYSPLPMMWECNSAEDAEKWRDEVFNRVMKFLHEMPGDWREVPATDDNRIAFTEAEFNAKK